VISYVSFVEYAMVPDGSGSNAARNRARIGHCDNSIVHREVIDLKEAFRCTDVTFATV